MYQLVDLTGKVALVTGASSGIGAETAIVFAALGARVAVGYNSNRTGVDKVCQAINEAGGTAVAVHGDMRQGDEISKIVTETEQKLGPIDILVNNAGSLIERVSFADLTEDKFDESIALNLKSAVFCAKAVQEGMKTRRHGSIINITSIAARNGGGPGSGTYSTAKGGLITFTKSLAKELAPFNVRVNGIAPGVIDTPFHEIFSTPEAMINFAKAIPLGRVGRPTECANVAAFLASDAASYLVGETIEVNGGLLML